MFERASGETVFVNNGAKVAIISQTANSQLKIVCQNLLNIGITS